MDGEIPPQGWQYIHRLRNLLQTMWGWKQWYCYQWWVSIRGGISANGLLSICVSYCPNYIPHVRLENDLTICRKDLQGPNRTYDLMIWDSSNQIVKLVSQFAVYNLRICQNKLHIFDANWQTHFLSIKKIWDLTICRTNSQPKNLRLFAAMISNTGFLLILAVAGVYYSYFCGTFWQNELTTNDNKWLLFKHSIIWWPFYDQVTTFMMPRESCGWPWQQLWRPVDDSDNNRWRPVDDPWWWHRQIL